MLEAILKAGKAGLADDKYTLLLGRKFFPKSEPGIRELTGVPPLSFNSDGTSLLDWHIKGAAGGVGKYTFNYLKQSAVSISNGQPSGSEYAGTISYSFARTGPSIPSGASYSANREQWLGSAYSKTITVSGNVLGIDDRQIGYDTCQYRFRLDAGSYKLIMEAFDHSGQWLSDRLTKYTSSASYRGTPVIALVKPNGQTLLSEQFDRSLYQGDNFVHLEYSFTITEPMEIGLFFDGMGHNISTEEFMPRFMVVDSDTVAQPFSITYATRVYEGVSCWDAPHAILPVRVSSGGQVTTVDISLGRSMLYENDEITFTGTSVTIPTYSGRNVLDVDSWVKPSEVYIKYMGT